MGKIWQTGPWNVESLGFYYGEDTAYEGILFEKFDDGMPVPDTKKCLYFECGPEFSTPLFRKEREIERYMAFPDNATIRVQKVPVAYEKEGEER